MIKNQQPFQTIVYLVIGFLSASIISSFNSLNKLLCKWIIKTNKKMLNIAPSGILYIELISNAKVNNHKTIYNLV
ncbi:hypothetical protein [Mycoplasma crocodyli]|uniref:hypothetical protein n=1 Tax=Mycoplasma crocodyli TaxID=50052 RepID=UPI0005A14C45|nr:hypothetical protein [Mycoplasma crocodyli]